MVAEDEEARRTGKLKPGNHVVNGVVTDPVHVELLEYQRERELKNMSRTVAAALEEWMQFRAARRASAPPPPATSSPPVLLIDLNEWQEVRGRVLELEEDGPNLIVHLEDEHGELVVTLETPPVGRELLVLGQYVGILKTDGAHFVRSLDAEAGGERTP